MANISAAEELMTMVLYAPISVRLNDAFQAQEGVLLTYDELTALLAFHEVVAGMLKRAKPTE